MQICSVILAGGGGTRFWPLSRQDMPKQLLKICGDDIMINDTISRCEGIIDFKDAYIVTGRTQESALREMLLPEIPRGNIIVEPKAQNTAACIALAAMVLKKRYGDATIVILPSDHYIGDEKGFRESILKACNVAQREDKLVTIGIKPDFASTGYGYIRIDSQKETGVTFAVEEFVEKPSFEKAKQYVDCGDYLWNSGMFIWKVSVILDNYKRYLPRMYKSMMKFYESIGTEYEKEVLDDVYNEVQSISIDYAIMERSDEVVVIPGDFGWNDVGSWDALGSVFPVDQHGNIIKAQFEGINTRNSIIYSTKRLITTIDVDNLIIADSDDALLICPKNKAQDVKTIVEKLKSKGMQEYL